MAKKTEGNQKINFHGSEPKRTTIGGGKLKMSSMNKSKRRNYKPYRGQGNK